MNIKRKLLSAAVTAALGVAGSAGAVNMSTNGTGQVLLFPYYTVQNGQATLISLVNTTDTPKALKVRFRESLDSREVLDFNLYMSAHDVWTGAVVADAGGGAGLVTNDTSCTVPAVPTDGTTDIAFRPYAYDGKVDAKDGAGTGVDRTKEGYLEVIEMGVPQPVDIYGSTTNFVTALTHKNGVPNDCQAIVDGWATSVGDGSDSPFNQQTNEMALPTGGIAGSASIINVANGTDFAYNPTVLANWANTTNYASTPDHYHTYPGSEDPSLQDSTATSSVITDTGGTPTVVTATWPNTLGVSNSADPVSSVMMATDVMNEYTVESDLNAGTDWVVTFPTKHFYVTTTTANAPFQAGRSFTSTGACQTIAGTIYDREEQTPTTQGGVDFSPHPVTVTENDLCWEANVITFGTSNVLSSVNALTVPTDYQNGWMDLTFTQSQPLISTDATPVTFSGLPVIGFAAQQYVNSNVSSGVMANYSGAFNHKYTVSVQ